MSTHENLSREESVPLPSNRSFGWVFAVVFLIISLAPMAFGGRFRLWAMAVAAVFAVLGWANAPVLTPLNRLWMRFGLLLHRIVSPVVLGFIFFVTITPIGWLVRRFGKDPMRRRLDKNASSYWIPREPRGPSRESMVNQF